MCLPVHRRVIEPSQSDNTNSVFLSLFPAQSPATEQEEKQSAVALNVSTTEMSLQDPDLTAVLKR